MTSLIIHSMIIKVIKITDIKPDPNQPRKVIKTESIIEMSKSMKTAGVINCIEVDEKNIIVTGERRWRAAKLAGLKKMDCKVLKINKDERFLRQLIENIHHNTMSPIDTAEAFKKLLKQAKKPTAPGAVGKIHTGGRPNEGQRWLADKIGISETKVREYLDLLKQSESFKKAVNEGVTYTNIRALNQVPEKFKKRLEKKIVKGEITSRDGAMAIASAIKNNPDLGNKILKKEYKNLNPIEVGFKLAEISPRLKPIHQKLRDAEKTPNLGSELMIELCKWLKENPIESIGKIHSTHLSMGAKITIGCINDWLKKKEITKLPNIIEGEIVK